MNAYEASGPAIAMAFWKLQFALLDVTLWGIDVPAKRQVTASPALTVIASGDQRLPAPVVASTACTTAVWAAAGAAGRHASAAVTASTRRLIPRPPSAASSPCPRAPASGSGTRT